MTKKEIIEGLVGYEFYYKDMICALNKNGDIIDAGEVVDNLYKLPMKWTNAVQFSCTYDEWVEPDDEETMDYIRNQHFQDEFGGIL